MKKLLAVLVTLLMAFSLVACGNNETEPQITETTTPSAEPTQDTTPIDASAVMTHEEFMAAEIDSKVVVKAYVQDTQSWWEDKITVYAQAEDGAYFFYNLACTKDDAAKLVPGTEILVEGYKAEWSGEVEVMDGRFEFVEGGNQFVAEALDATELLGTEELVNYQNQKVAFKGLTIEASKDPEGNDVAFLYNWDGSGTNEGNSDLYFNASYNGETYSFCVESYLRGNDTDVYKAVEALNVGDIINAEGFMYWYEGPQPHITSVEVQ